MTARKILIAGIVSDEYTVSINFTTTLIRLQQRIATQGTHACPVTFEFFRHVDDAVMFFERDASLTRLVVLDGGMSCDIDFILFPHTSDVVIPAYPIRGVNWSKVAYVHGATDTARTRPTDVDTLRRAGVDYNFVHRPVVSGPTGPTGPTGSSASLEMGRYIQAENPQAKIMSISRAGVACISSNYDPKTCKLDTICTIDVTARCVNTGPYDFTGCVGTRLLQGRV